MKIAIIGASGKLGLRLVETSLERGHQVVAVCRHGSIGKLADFEHRSGFARMSAAVWPLVRHSFQSKFQA